MSTAKQAHIIITTDPVEYTPPHPGFIYCLVDDLRRPTVMKIGHTKNVESRLKQIQTGYPMDLHLWWKHEGSREEEQAMHYCMRHYRHNGGRQREWYIATPESIQRAAFHQSGPMSDSYIDRMAWIKKLNVYEYLKKKTPDYPTQLWRYSYRLRAGSWFRDCFEGLCVEFILSNDQAVSTKYKGLNAYEIGCAERIYKAHRNDSMTDRDVFFVLNLAFEHAAKHGVRSPDYVSCLLEIERSQYRLKNTYKGFR